jgi:putative DNA primase/helicase
MDSDFSAPGPDEEDAFGKLFKAVSEQAAAKGEKFSFDPPPHSAKSPTSQRLWSGTPLIGYANISSEPPVLDPKTPLDSAKLFVAAKYTQSAVRTLHHQNDAFYAWNGTHYIELDACDIRARLYDFLSKGVIAHEGKTGPFNPNRTRVADVLDALKAVTNLPTTVEAPAWLGEQASGSARDIIACRNGLLNVATRTLTPSTPMFYTHNALDFDYDPDAKRPETWLKFMGDLWPDDPEAIDTLHEMFGYILTADTSQQKAFMIVGPTRSGKGTIARILEMLVGLENAVSPTTSSITAEFGMQPLIGKRLATVSDARLSGRDQQVFVERFLSITGEDSVTIPRKYQMDWTGRLQLRFLFLSNELPHINDASGASVGRFVVLIQKISFLGREDLGLEKELLCELPGILNLALEGLARLSARGHFRQPASSTEAIRDLEDLGSPVRAFLRDCCVIGPGRTVGVDTLFAEWKTWCENQGRDHPGTRQNFGRDLRAVLPTLKMTQPRDATGHRVRLYEGLSLKDE